MKTRLKTKIDLELEETIIIRSQRTLTVWCEACRRRTPMIAVDGAALMTGLSGREIYRLVEAGVVHFIEDHNRLLFVCLISISRIAAPYGLSLIDSEGEQK